MTLLNKIFGVATTANTPNNPFCLPYKKLLKLDDLQEFEFNKDKVILYTRQFYNKKL